jgi:hypothetical protein
MVIDARRYRANDTHSKAVQRRSQRGGKKEREVLLGKEPDGREGRRRGKRREGW